ncbi:MAG TPA: hypothetical protein VGY91_09705 [Chthoniobacterales bacterium]|jgi:hypothetical protein|nr:hypothetical protein [Chthoniobacterales bacterium]
MASYQIFLVEEVILPEKVEQRLLSQLIKSVVLLIERSGRNESFSI